MDGEDLIADLVKAQGLLDDIREKINDQEYKVISETLMNAWKKLKKEESSGNSTLFISRANHPIYHFYSHNVDVSSDLPPQPFSVVAPISGPISVVRGPLTTSRPRPERPSML